jgi:chromate reductase
MDYVIFQASQGKNAGLAQSIQGAFDSIGVRAVIVDVPAMDLPLYTTAKQAEGGIPDAVRGLMDTCLACRGYVFVAPEYNGGIPPVLTNVLAWISVGSDHWRDCFNGKIAGIATVSGGMGSNLVVSLRVQLAHLGLTVLGRALAIPASQPVDEARVAAFVGEYNR